VAFRHNEVSYCGYVIFTVQYIRTYSTYWDAKSITLPLSTRLVGGMCRSVWLEMAFVFSVPYFTSGRNWTKHRGFLFFLSLYVCPPKGALGYETTKQRVTWCCSLHDSAKLSCKVLDKLLRCIVTACRPEFNFVWSLYVFPPRGALGYEARIN